MRTVPTELLGHVTNCSLLAAAGELYLLLGTPSPARSLGLKKGWRDPNPDSSTNKAMGETIYLNLKF